MGYRGKGKLFEFFGRPVLCTLCLLLAQALCKLQFDFFFPLCHAPLNGSLQCSALKAMCAHSCSCGLPDVDQCSSNIFIVQGSRTRSAAHNEQRYTPDKDAQSCSRFRYVMVEVLCFKFKKKKGSF